MQELPVVEQAKIVGVAAGAVAVAGFWAILLMAPVDPPAAPLPVVQQQTSTTIGALP